MLRPGETDVAQIRWYSLRKSFLEALDHVVSDEGRTIKFAHVEMQGLDHWHDLETPKGKHLLRPCDVNESLATTVNSGKKVVE